jgi:zinc/manganese transport system substrate-binding protein
MMRRVRWAVLAVALAAMAVMVAPSAKAASNKVSVVAAEDFWGSIARQLGGEHAEVSSVIADPDTDPHDYEAKPSDGAAVAKAQVAIVNGIGYDGWMAKLVAANPSPSRKVVTVGDVVGVKEGGNPHQWYSPRSVNSVIDAVTEALKAADPADAAYFDVQRQTFRTEGLKRYDELRAQIKEQFNGVEVGASESIFAPLAEDLGLKLVTPESFIDAVSEGNEPTAKDKATVDRQITSKQIKVFVYNEQNSTPDVEALVGKAKKAGIPVTTVTETLVPKGATFQEWQATQLQSLAEALARSTGKAAPAVGAAQAPASAAPTPGTAAPADARSSSGDTAPSADSAASMSGAPASGLAHTGASARWLVLMAGVAFVVGGLGLAGGATPRRGRPPMRGA